MFQKIKNIIIFLVIIVVLILGYIYLFRGEEDPNLIVTSTAEGTVTTLPDGTIVPLPGADFLTLLLSLKTIRLENSIFSDPAFISLQDSSIVLVQDVTEGRPNPFAPIGTENIQAGSAGATN
jgi:hypothetical protein